MIGKTLKVYEEEYNKIMEMVHHKNISVAIFMKELMDREYIKYEELKKGQKTLF